MPIHNDRIKRIFDNLTEPVDLIFIKNAETPHLDQSFFYITNTHQGLFENAIALAYPNGDLHVITSKLEQQNLNPHADADIIQHQKYADHIKKHIPTNTTIGINAQELTHKDYLKLQKNTTNCTIINISDTIYKTRMIKDHKEIDYIKKACRITDTVAESIPNIVHQHTNPTETTLAAEIDYHLKQHGSSKPAFDTIIAAGKNTANPHHTPTDKQLQNNEPLLFDFGATNHKYCADLTRTYLMGTASQQFKTMYTTVREAQHKAFDLMEPGVPCEEIHQAVKQHIDNTDFKDKFIHSTGHSLGLSVHDGGRLTEGNQDPLEENMVFTVEPGIYLPNIGGIRIEDDVRITQSGVEVLTTKSSPHLPEI